MDFTVYRLAHVLVLRLRDVLVSNGRRSRLINGGVMVT